MSYFEKRRQVVRGESERLKVFLMSRLQPWRWPVMLANGGIRVERGGVPVPNLTLDYQLSAGDVVVLDDAFGLTWSALIREASRSYRDYVFADPTATDAYITNKKEVLLRSPTAVAVSPDVPHLHALVKSLTRLGTNPIRHLVLVSHANAFGDIALPLRDLRSGEPDYATMMSWDSLKAAVAEKLLRIEEHNDNPVILPRPESAQGRFIPCALILRGCRAGLHANLLAKIREAFGPMIDIVVMSKFYEAADFIGKTATSYAAAVEYFMHEFTVSAKLPLSRAKVIEALKQEKFTDWLNAPVPDREWDTLVPADVTHSADSRATREIRVRVRGRDREATLRGRFDSQLMTTNTLLMTSATKPTDAEIRAAMIRNWETLPMFRDAEWPIWTRLGLESKEAFFDYWTYAVDADAKKSLPADRWPVNARRSTYTVRTPLIDGGTLLCNYYPEGEPGTQTTGIDLNDDRIFGRASFIPRHFEQTL